jgi:hypothetical protein
MFSPSYAPRAKKESFVAETGCVPLRYVARTKRTEHREYGIIQCKPRCLHLEIGFKNIAIKRSVIAFVKNKTFISKNYSLTQNTRRVAERIRQNCSYLRTLSQLLRYCYGKFYPRASV